MRTLIAIMVALVLGFWMGYEVGSAPVRNDWGEEEE